MYVSELLDLSAVLPLVPERIDGWVSEGHKLLRETLRSLIRPRMMLLLLDETY